MNGRCLAAVPAVLLRIRHIAYGVALAVGWMLIAPSASRAAIVINSDLTIVENRPTNDNFGFPGLHLLTRVNVTHTTGGTAALTGPPANATVSSDNGSFPFADPTTLSMFSPIGSTGASFSHLFDLTGVDLNDIEGTYTYTVTDNTSASAMYTGNDLQHARVVPHPTDLMPSDNSTTPMFTFEDPDPNPGGGLDRVYQLVIFDSANNEVAILPSPSMASSTPEFQVTPGLLTAGQLYWFRAQSIDIDQNDFSVENIGESLYEFTPVPESSHAAALGALLISAMALCERWRA
jgi:hypothetical protein